MADAFQTEYKAAFEAATGETPKQALDSGFKGIDPEILKTAASALQAYAASPEGKAALANAPALSPSMLGQLFGGALNSSWFKSLITKLEEISPIKAVSLGLMGQAEIVVGIGGTVGYAMDIKGFGTTSAIYAGGALELGADLGLEASLCIGLWHKSTADIGGSMTGVEVDVTDVIGMDAAAFASDSEIKNLDSVDDVLDIAEVVFVGIDVGIDDGVEGDEYYFFAGHLSDYPSFQSGPYDNIVMLKHLVCENSYAALGTHDEVYLTYTVDNDNTTYRYPIWNTFSLNEGDDDTWHCGNMIKFNDKFTITLEVNQGEIPSGPKITVTWHASDFTSGNNYQKQKTFDNDANWHENTVTYSLNVELISVT